MHDAYFIYLPTYRRIEQELKVVLNGRLDEDDISSYKRIQHQSDFHNFMEMIEFGMSDVETAIVETLDSLKDFFRSNLTSLTLDYFGEIVEQEYQNVNLSLLSDVDEETIKHILNRVDETILSDDNKNHLSATIMSIKYKDAAELICDYLAAGRTYMGDKFTYHKEYEWWLNKRTNCAMHPHTKRFVSLVFRELKVRESENWLEGYVNDDLLTSGIVKGYYNLATRHLEKGIGFDD